VLSFSSRALKTKNQIIKTNDEDQKNKTVMKVFCEFDHRGPVNDFFFNFV